MTTKESEYCIVIHANNEEKSRFSRMKSFLRKKIANMMYAIRETASSITINGRRIIAQPDEVPAELRSISVKQLGKIKKALAAISEEANGPGLKESRYFWRPGICAPTATPRNGFEEEDEDIRVVHEHINTTGEGKMKQTSTVASVNVNTCVEIRHEDGCNINMESNTNNPVECSTPSEKREVLFETRKLARKPRPQAAKGERNGTVIPSYIIIDEESTTPITTRQRKRPSAAKGKRTVSTSADLFDLPVDVLLERFRDPSLETKPKRNRPQAPRGRVNRVPEVSSEGQDEVDNGETYGKPVCNDTTSLSELVGISNGGIDAKDEINKNNVAGKVNEDDTTSLDELLEDLGIHTAWKAKERTVVKASCIDKWLSDEEEEEIDGDLFGVPYLPKSQRKGNNGNGLQRRF